MTLKNNDFSNIIKYIIVFALTILCAVFTSIFIILNIMNVHSILKTNSSIKYSYRYNDYESKKIDGKIEEISCQKYLDEMSEIKKITKQNFLIFPDSFSNNANFFSYTENYFYDLDSIKYRSELYLEVKYDNYDLYNDEINRLKNIKCNDKNAINSNDLFLYDSYITIYNDDSQYEYCLINKDDRTIYYIYLNEVGINNFIFDESFIPKKRLFDSNFPKEFIKINYYNIYVG